MQLPIMNVLPELKAAFHAQNSAVLIAEPGAGKTTQTPLAFLGETWLNNKKIVMLEPRRLAARSAASYMAASLGEKVGQTVGYRVRMDTRVSRDTAIEVVTEGILTRMLQSDPELAEVGMIIFDEFHERSIHADTGLALALETQSVLREDLRLLVMSATLEAEPVAGLLGGAPVIRCAGRSFPVDTEYIPPASGRSTEQAAAGAIARALSETSGDVLVFLPGGREIRRTAEALRSERLPGNMVIRQLYGQLSTEQQDEAVQPDPEGRRKIVLSTPIAETSLTIEGVMAVVDSGYMRTEVLSPRTGLPHLVTMRVSKASADQRRGRAGRLAPGKCYRLWSPEEHARLQEMNVPDILQTDLAPLALELAVWGVKEPSTLSWLDEPSPILFQQGRELLRQLGALDDSGAVTEHGRSMAELGVHPRLAHMLLKGKELGQGALACRLAVLIQEREALSGPEAYQDRDIRTRVERLLQQEQGRRPEDRTGAFFRIQQDVRHLQDKTGVSPSEVIDPDHSGLLLSFAYPDRIGKNRGGGSFLLRSGRGAALGTVQTLSRSAYIVAASIQDQGADGSILLAAPLEEALLEQHYGHEMKKLKEVGWDPSSGSVRARIRWMLGAIVVKEAPDPRPLDEDMSRAILQAIRKEGLRLLQWSKQGNQLRERMNFMHHHDPAWPDVSDEGLLATLEEWLAPYLAGIRSRNDLQRLRPGELLEHLLTWEQSQQLQKEAPTHIEVPSGSRIPVSYENPEAPALAVRLQEVFGLLQTPRVAGGRVPVTLHLLSPAQRPVQMTSDLESFWRSGYFDVKKDLKGRYPKHYWPDDPLQAVATRRTKPKPNA